MNRKLLEHFDVIIIALIPFFYLAINPAFGQNQTGDIDIWFYYGLAKSFWHQLGPDFYNDYYETRLPYIIPAAIIFAIPSDRIASFVLSYLVYCTCTFSLFYVLSKHISKSAALLTTILMAGDIYFMRAVGWQYVDGGILAYGSLTFATLSAAGTSRHGYLLLGLSGFLFASMVMIHLGSATLGLALLGYAVLTFDMTRTPWRRSLLLLLCAALGAVSCQLIYGALNMFLYQTSFFFEEQQIIAGTLSQANPDYFESLNLLLASGAWLSIHTGVWLAAGAMIIATLARVFSPNRFQAYCMWAVFSTYSILFLLEYFRVAYFLGRSGLYASFFLFLSYLFIGSIVPAAVGALTTLTVGSLFLLSLILRVRFDFEFGDDRYLTSALATGVMLGALVASVALEKNRFVPIFATAAALVLSLSITWPFSYQENIYAARQAIAKAVGDDLPYFAFSESDSIYIPVILGLVGSFTPRAWWIKCSDFPNCLPSNVGHRMMIVVTSNSDLAETYDAASSAMPEAMLSKGDLIYRSNDNFSVYGFMIGR